MQPRLSLNLQANNNSCVANFTLVGLWTQSAKRPRKRIGWIGICPAPGKDIRIPVKSFRDATLRFLSRIN